MDPAVEWRTAAPAPPLRAVRRPLRRLPPRRLSRPVLHRGLPSRHMTFIVSIGPGIDVGVPDRPGQTPATLRLRGERPAGELGADRARRVPGGRRHRADPARVRGRCSACRPGPCGTRRSSAPTSPGRPGASCGSGSRACRRWAARFAVCDEVLTRLAGARRHGGPELRHAWQRAGRLRGHRADQRAGRRAWAGAASTSPAGSATSSASGPSWPRGSCASSGPAHMLQSTPSFVTIASGRRRVRLLRPGAPRPRLRRAGGVLAHEPGSPRSFHLSKTRPSPTCDRGRMTIRPCTPRSGPSFPTATPERHSTFLAKAFGFEERACYTRDGRPVDRRARRDALAARRRDHVRHRGQGRRAVRSAHAGNDSVYVVVRRPRRALRAGHRRRRRGRARADATRTTAPAASPSATPRATSGASGPTPASDGSGDRAEESVSRSVKSP